MRNETLTPMSPSPCSNTQRHPSEQNLLSSPYTTWPSFGVQISVWHEAQSSACTLATHYIMTRVSRFMHIYLQVFVMRRKGPAAGMHLGQERVLCGGKALEKIILEEGGKFGRKEAWSYRAQIKSFGPLFSQGWRRRSTAASVVRPERLVPVVRSTIWRDWRKCYRSSAGQCLAPCLVLNAGQSTTHVPKNIVGDNVQVRKLWFVPPHFLKHINFTRRQWSFCHLFSL
jgi:hypothetical protein